jgi:hypothetical protein
MSIKFIKYSAYINVDGFVTAQPNADFVPGEGNGWLRTGLAFACGMMPLDHPYGEMIEKCRVSSTCPFIFRSPYKKNLDDNQRADDYWGALLLSQSWAAQVLEYCEKNGWNFSLREIDVGDLNYRYDRIPVFPSFVRMCAGKKISLWEEIVFALTIFVDAFKISDADGNAKAFCRLSLARQESKLCSLFSKFWIIKIKLKYETIGGSWAESISVGHPLSNYDE